MRKRTQSGGREEEELLIHPLRCRSTHHPSSCDAWEESESSVLLSFTNTNMQHVAVSRTWHFSCYAATWWTVKGIVFEIMQNIKTEWTSGFFLYKNPHCFFRCGVAGVTEMMESLCCGVDDNNPTTCETVTHIEAYNALHCTVGLSTGGMLILYYI